MDHIKVDTLFLRIRAARSPERKMELFHELKSVLQHHMRVEEEVFYPACREIDELRPLITSSFEEHQRVKAILRDMSKLTFASARMDSKLRLLITEVEQHVMEEENEIFPEARRIFSRSRLEELRDDIAGIEEGKKRPQRATRKKAA